MTRPEPSAGKSAASPREILAWAFYDFANSGYTTVVLTTIYSAYFVAVVAADLEMSNPGTATLLWTLGIGAANLLVLFASPVIGAMSDVRACKKRFLLYSSIACVLGTAALAAAGPGDVVLALSLVVVSYIAFSFGESLIAAFLPEIATPKNMGRISGYGWGLGYFGGLLTLGCCLAYINHATELGKGADHYVPVALLLTATVFALTAAPTFIWLRERATPRLADGTTGYVRAAFAQVASTLRHAASLPDLFRFLLCIVLFQAGVSTVVVVAAIYAQEVMSFSSQQLIVLIMVVNLTAALGALIFGFAQDRFGSVPSLAAALLLWITAIVIALLGESEAMLWLAGNVIGLAMGATQAGGRALIGQLTPEAHNGEMFGLWGLANRAAAIVGPVSYGLINKIGNGDHQLSMLSTLAFFLGGLALLLTVREARGRAAAQAYAG
ncbi:MFS transporter [Halioglobus maricola]|uniref:MFS transporter n=1 Tax=Halioglobus maricola TaxID=2601894 RepID=A0A5P9NLD1_9GAMM|nr:MFS transporter [Halioglobus maricola]QFU76587.1 MFS transporter [Halioglobus maricola]